MNIMASWILVPCLVTLRNEFNTLAPSRDVSSDGSIGDSAHASSSSDHNPDETGRTPYEDADNINEVHAIDVDVNLNRTGWTMTKAVDIIVTRHRNGYDDRLQNVIYNGLIYSESWGWTAKEYTGANPHKLHAHFSAKYITRLENDIKPWGLLNQSEDNVFPEMGDSGQTVKYWQNMYNMSRTFFTPDLPVIEVDGDYGPKTAEAFAKFYTALSTKTDYNGQALTGWMGMKIQQIFAMNVTGIK